MHPADRDEELNALLDQELSVEQTAALAQHLADCPGCAAKLAQLALLRQALARVASLSEPSPDLRTRIEALLDAETRVARGNRVLPFRVRPSLRRVAWMSTAVAAAAAVVILLSSPKDETHEFMAVRDAAMRTNLPQTSAAAAAPAVPGFTLASARADMVAGHPAQVLVYKSNGETITLCVWQANGEPAHGVRNANYQSMEISYWNDGENEYWAASAQPDVNLNNFVDSLTAG